MDTEFKRLFQIFLLAILILSAAYKTNLLAQTKIIGGIAYPNNFRIDTLQSRQKINKASTDTLSYKTFKKIKNDFVLIDGCGNYDADQSNPNIAADGIGNYIAVWEDKRTGYIEIDAQLFNTQDGKIGEVIKVSDNYSYWNSEPHVVFNEASGEYIITWASSGADVLLQRISKSGEKIGSNYSITRSGIINTNNPSAAVDKQGNIMVTWYSGPDYSRKAEAYYCMYDKNISPLMDQQQISLPPSDNLSSIGWDDRIASDTLGNFIITWSCHFNNTSRIMIQQVSDNGNMSGRNIIVSDTNDLTTHYFPTIAGTKDGYYFILWQGQLGLLGRIYKADSGFVTPQFEVAKSPNTWFTYSVKSDDKDNFYIIFTGMGSYTQIISKYGTPKGNIRPVNIINTTNYAFYPKLSNAADGNIYCVYSRYNKNDQDVFLQKFDTSFNVSGTSLKLSNDPCSAFQTDPVVKYNNSGRALAAWIDRRDGTDNLYAQVLDENSNPVSGNFLVNDTTRFYVADNPFITTDKDGNFLICFAGGDYSSKQICIRKISPDGKIITGFNAITGNYNPVPGCAVQSDGTGDILLYWYDGSAQLYLLKLNKALQSIGNLIKLTPSLTNNPKELFGVSVNKNFNIVLMWADLDSATYQSKNILRGGIYNDQGIIVSGPFVIDTLSSDREYLNGACKIDDNNNTVFEWSDNPLYYYDTKITIKRRYVKESCVNIFSNTINNDQLHTSLQIINFSNNKVFAAWTSFEKINSLLIDDNSQSYLPVRLQTLQPFINLWGGQYDAYSADIYNNKILFSYESIINPDRGYDIWVNTQQMDSFNFNPDPYSILNTGALEKVSSPFPNPVTAHINLTYQLLQSANVKISIYNILGQKISEIQEGVKGPGVYNAEFNTNGLPTGIYFIYYRGINSYTKKFLIVK
ncbi:MAG: T9SS type A sorting domain-containing protein [Bacteroidetes bacterium]|nr:T9SS type A sorting domain-containing protein [Bacteroidota bacterium]